MGAANRKGVINVMAELGGAGQVDRAVLRRTERGLRRILHSLGMLPGYQPDAALGTRALHACGVISARGSGVFEPLKEIGEDTQSAEVVARIHIPDTPGARPIDVVSPHTGIVLAKRAMAQVERGDALFQIAQEAE